MILLAGFDEAGARAAGLAERTQVAHVATPEELDRVLAEHDAPWEAILVGPEMRRPIETARRIRARHERVPVLLLVPTARCAKLQHELLITPMRGEPVRCVPLDEHAPQAIESHLVQAKLRRRHAQTLQASLPRALPPGPDTPPRLPPVVEQFLDAARTPVLLAQPDGRLLHRNQEARELHDGADAGAATLAEALPTLPPHVHEALLRAEGATQRIAIGERHFDASATRLPLAPQREAVLLILHDVTPLVRSEALRRQQAELHESFLAAQSDLGEGVLFIEHDRVAHVNDALAGMLGCDAESLVGTQPIDMIAPDERDKVLERFERRKRGEPVPSRYESVLLDASGERIDVEIITKRLPGRDASLALVRDLRPRRAMEADLERTRLALAQTDKLASMGSLVGGLAHEIRTPLTAVLNHAHHLRATLERGVAANALPESLRHSLRRDLDGIDEGVDRVRHLVRDLRGFLRGEVPHKRRGRLDEPVREALRLFAATQRGRVEVRARLASGATILADPAQIQQILVNLVQNAADATPSGGEVLVETRDAEDAVELIVTDRGAGIPDSVRGTMFEAFVTTKPGGTGLGLTIVRRLAELHDAKIVFTTAPGEGTTFRVRFPRAPLA